MSRDECCISGCGTTRRMNGIERMNGIDIFQMPCNKDGDETYNLWREVFIEALFYSRGKDEVFRQQLTLGMDVYVCEKHFEKDEIEVCVGPNGTMKTMKFGAIPTLQMFAPSEWKRLQPPELISCRLQEEYSKQCQQVDKPDCQLIDKDRVPYKSFEDLKFCLNGLKCLESWDYTCQRNIITLQKVYLGDCIPKYEVVITETLKYCILVYGWKLPKDHAINIIVKPCRI